MRHRQRKALVIGCVVILVLFVVKEIWLDKGKTNNRYIWLDTGETNNRLFTASYKALQQKPSTARLHQEESQEKQLGHQMSASSKESPSDKIKTTQATISQLAPHNHYNNNLEDLRICSPMEDPSSIQTAFKFYVYDLPSKFNFDIQRQFTYGKSNRFCYNLDYCGMGEALVEDQHGSEGNITNHGSLSIRNTHQFALEVIIHYKLLHSPYRTLDPQQADMFYIPAYTGLYCLQFKGDSGEFVKDLFEHLETHETKYYKSGKPHFSTLSKIQKEQGSDTCPTLKHPATQNVTFFTIEKEVNPDWTRVRHLYGTSVIVAPYPSYIHLTNIGLQDKSLYETSKGLTNLTLSKFRLRVPALSERNVTLFLAAGTRRSNSFRAKLLDQFTNQTSFHPDKFLQDKVGTMKQVMLITKECSKDHRTTTIPWMRRSVFCLQPPGDSPTRKSIYDSILSGCIPVLFTHPSSHHVEFPFMKYLNYDTFTYTVDEKLISRYNKNIYDIIRDIPHTKVTELHENLLKVAKWFQYSLPNGDIQWEDDAMTLLMHQVTSLYNLTSLPISFV